MSLILPALGDGMPVTILELGPTGRTVTFAGKDRPEPVTRTTVQRAIQSWYPGATEASTQVLGTKEEPVTFQGWFRDPVSIFDGGPQARMSVLRGIQQGQRLCRLMWGDTIVLYGRIERLTFQTERMNKVRYEFEFAVDKSEEPAAPVGIVGVSTVAADVVDTLQVVGALFSTAADVVRAGSALGAFVPE